MANTSSMKISLRLPVTVLATILLAPYIQPALAQAPVNDVVSWPAGMLLLASVLYAALGTAPDRLWEIEPSAGIFLWTGLPKISIPTMRRVMWVSRSCHFVGGIRSAYGQSNFWVQSEKITSAARSEALRKVLSVLSCVTYANPEGSIDESLWTLTPAGLVIPAGIPLHSAPIKPLVTPSPRDFLLFAAIDYHFFRSWEVQIFSKEKMIFSTKGLPPSSAVDVDSEEFALAVVAAHMVGRPHSQSPIRALADHQGEDEVGPSILHLERANPDALACAIDFHSYAPQPYKVAASLKELAGAYYRVIQYLKQSSDEGDPSKTGLLAKIDVGQTLWISNLGGALLDEGRLSIQNLPGRWGILDISADDAYVSRIDAILDLIKPYANTPAFGDLVVSGGINRLSAYPFLIAGVFGQAIVCYFLSVGTSAGVWTSVALANSLYAGKLTDLHSLGNGKMSLSEEPGMKMYLPGTKDYMAVATFNRSSPRESLRPGILLNSIGILAASFGAVFEKQTRNALGFSTKVPTPSWVIYTSVVLTISVSILIAISTIIQQGTERTWRRKSLMPTRWMMYFTLIPSCLVGGLAVFLQQCNRVQYWPFLDLITFMSGLPLGMLENGRMFSSDDNVLHLVLLNRWIMGAVASSVGSSDRSGGQVC